MLKRFPSSGTTFLRNRYSTYHTKTEEHTNKDLHNEVSLDLLPTNLGTSGKEGGS